jgi:hypothetical protein
VFFGRAARVRHSFNDPAGVGVSEETRLEEFRRVRDELQAYLKSFSKGDDEVHCERPRNFVPILYHRPAFEAFGDFYFLVESVSCRFQKTCQVRGSNSCRRVTRRWGQLRLWSRFLLL